MERVLKSIVAVFIGLAIFLSFPKAFADKFNTETSDDARGLAMGTAVLNSARGGYAVFSNPANIAAKDTGTNFQLVNLQLGVTDGALATGSYTGFTSLSSLYTTLKNKPNEFAGGRYSVFPNITFRNLSLGMLYEVDQGAEYRAYDGALRVKARDRFAPTAALSFRLLSGMLRFGASAQYLTVGDADTTVGPPVPTALDYKSYIKAGSGLVTTAGTTLSFPFRYLPSFSLVARNLGNTKFTGAPMIKFGSGTISDVQPMTVDMASSMVFYLAHRLELKVEMDYRDVTNRLQGGRFRHVFAGSELILFDFFRLRSGLAHGYPSFGLGIDTRKASIDFAAYADEKDDRLRGSKEQCYVFQYTWGLFK